MERSREQTPASLVVGIYRDDKTGEEQGWEEGDDGIYLACLPIITPPTFSRTLHVGLGTLPLRQHSRRMRTLHGRQKHRRQRSAARGIHHGVAAGLTTRAGGQRANVDEQPLRERSMAPHTRGPVAVSQTPGHCTCLKGQGDRGDPGAWCAGVVFSPRRDAELAAALSFDSRLECLPT